MISSYLREIARTFQKYGGLILEHDYSVGDDPDTSALFVKGWAVFMDHSILEFAEKYSRRGHRYRFQYMDRNRRLICRWDNVPHHRNIETFPHHKHIRNGIEPSYDINLIEALNHILSDLDSSK